LEVDITYGFLDSEANVKMLLTDTVYCELF